ncbi:MAG TPA: hypothetical protein VM285_12150 [Polyangia bacterium]|nr:hypothetical protein [Polyangia bacterium]
MDADGRLFGKRGGLEKRARLVALYEKVAEQSFCDLAGIPASDLEALARIHDLRLGHYTEERRMHFGAFALVGLAAMILLPAVLTLDDYFLPLAGVELLLLALLVPYTFYYRKYEENTRRMMRESFLIENARLLAEEDPAPAPAP